jgi:AraC-like DNA-binding protein
MLIAVAGLVALAFLIAGVAIFQFVSYRDQLEHRLRDKLARYDYCVKQYQERLALIEPYVSDYMNSLGRETVQALLKVRRLMMAHRKVIEEIESLLVSHDYCSYPESERVIDSILPEARSLQRGGRSSSAYNAETLGSVPLVAAIPKDWELETETLLQMIGSDVYQASLRAKEIRLPKGGRKRRSTSSSLSMAKIRAVDPAGLE